MSKDKRSPLLVIALLVSAVFLSGTTQALAHDGDRYRDGYQDRNGNYHQYGYHHHHRGYWNQHNGVRFWINVG